MKTTITLNNGNKVEGSLGMAALRSLRAKNKSLYTSASRVILGGATDVEDVTKTLYASYVAVTEQPMPEDEFFSLLPDSISEQVDILAKIIQQ